MFAEKVIEHKKWEEILESAKQLGLWGASKKHYAEVGMDLRGLYSKLKKFREREGWGEGAAGGGELQKAVSKAQARKEAYEGIKLTVKEKQLISDIAEGKVDLETASRVIASKAFEKLLKFPDSASFTSFIQAELLKLKRQELNDKNTWAMELINRMFNGELPPRVCPVCGEVLVKLPVVSGGEITMEDESV